MNALYLSSSGSFYDYFNGEKDITNNQVKFIGKIDKRIQEDYLRIFRYYRFLGCFKYLNIIEGYQESLIKHIPQIKKYIKFEIMRNEILKMLKNKYAINSLRDFNRIGKKNELRIKPQKKKKETIPKKLRIKVWEKRFGDMGKGNCFCCQSELDKTDFHTGHIVSEFEGGKIEVNNFCLDF